MWWAAGRASREQRLVQSMLRRGWIPLVRVVGRGRRLVRSRGCRGRTQFLSCGVPGCSICINLPVTRFLWGGLGGVVISHTSQRHTVHSDATLGAQDLRTTTTHFPTRRKKADAAKERRHATARTCAATSYQYQYCAWGRRCSFCFPWSQQVLGQQLLALSSSPAVALAVLGWESPGRYSNRMLEQRWSSWRGLSNER